MMYLTSSQMVQKKTSVLGVAVWREKGRESNTECVYTERGRGRVEERACAHKAKNSKMLTIKVAR